jgi:lysine 2,3-aminomutase
MHDDWMKSLRASVRTLEELYRLLPLTAQEKSWTGGDCSLPLGISRYFLGLIDPHDPQDPLRRQVVPTCHESSELSGESGDPLAEVSHTAAPRLIHRYHNRAAFLVTDTCATYCRHCFRRRFTGASGGKATLEDVSQAALYVASHPEIKELLFTGGDPFTLSDIQLEQMIQAFRTGRPDLLIRLCTRTPATFPERITATLITMLKRHTSAPFYLLTQFNHPREITPESRAAVALFVDAGIPALNQTVMLQGVNDEVDTLESLMNALVAIRVKPYYLFQGDLVRGTAHFRVPLAKGMALEAELRTRLSGLAMPVYALDLPDGGGKIPIGERYCEGRDEQGAWIFRTPEGQRRRYPDPDFSK